MNRDARRLMEHMAELGRQVTLRDPLSNWTGMGAELTPPQMHAVMWLHTDGALPMATLAARIGCAGPTATGVVDRLEQMALCARRPKPGDRRVVLVDLTDGGRELAARLEAIVGARIEGMLQLLSVKDRKALIEIIGRLVAALKSAPMDAGYKEHA